MFSLLATAYECETGLSGFVQYPYKILTSTTTFEKINTDTANWVCSHFGAAVVTDGYSKVLALRAFIDHNCLSIQLAAVLSLTLFVVVPVSLMMVVLQFACCCYVCCSCVLCLCYCLVCSCCCC